MHLAMYYSSFQADANGPRGYFAMLLESNHSGIETAFFNRAENSYICNYAWVWR